MYTCVVLVNMVNCLSQIDKGTGGNEGVGPLRVETNKNSTNSNHSFFGHKCNGLMV